jgi:sec-independent protein translocase protein TatC
MAADMEIPLSGHLEELRRRLGKTLLATAVAFAVCYPQSEAIFAFILQPLLLASATAAKGAELIGTGIAEAFFTRLRVSLIAALFLAMPVILYQLWAFVTPALKQTEARYARYFVVFGSIFFLAGAWFCYDVVFSVGFPFFLAEYDRIGVDPAIRISEYLSFSSRLLLAFGLTFEMPVATFFFARVGLITHKTLLGHSRYAVLGLFIISAILTPPDVASQILMVVPLMVLYMVSIAVAYLFRRKDGERRGQD